MLVSKYAECHILIFKDYCFLYIYEKKETTLFAFGENHIIDGKMLCDLLYVNLISQHDKTNN